MKILLTGGTGFIGSAIINYLSSSSHDLIILTRGESRIKLRGSLKLHYVQWNPNASGAWEKEVNGCDVVINLIGKNVFEQRWNNKVKQEILQSRVLPTKMLVDAIAHAERKPTILISASAVGFYGNRQDEIITEESSGGDDFLSDVVKQWEEAAYEAQRSGVRVATPRIGLVLEKSGGMIGKMLLPFQLFVGGPIGNGKQYLPWVHMADVVRGILYPMEHPEFQGIYNLVSPHPVSMNEFAKTFGTILHRPSWIPVPDLALSALYGEGAKVILSGQRAIPAKLQSAGYQFSFPELSAALNNILT